MTLPSWVPFTWAFVVLSGFQAAAVVLPRTPPVLPFLRARPIWGIVPLLGIGGGVILIGNVPGAAQRAVDLAAIVTPIAATAGLLAFRHWLLAVPMPVLWVIAWQSPHSRWGQLAACALIIGAAVTLGWLTGAVAPVPALAIGILVATVVDVYQVMSIDVQPVATALYGAAPPAGLPHLQQLEYIDSTMGWGDAYLAALLGAIVARCTRWTILATIVTFVASVLWAFMFRVWDTLPATVPVSAGLLAVGLLERDRVLRWLRTRRRPRPRVAARPAAGPSPDR